MEYYITVKRNKITVKIYGYITVCVQRGSSVHGSSSQAVISPDLRRISALSRRSCREALRRSTSTPNPGGVARPSVEGGVGDERVDGGSEENWARYPGGRK